MNLADLFKKAAKESRGQPKKYPTITGTPKEFPGYRSTFCYGMRWICCECCEKYGEWDGTMAWEKGNNSCDWCQKKDFVIEVYYCGFPDGNLKDPPLCSVLDIEI